MKNRTKTLLIAGIPLTVLAVLLLTAGSGDDQATGQGTLAKVAKLHPAIRAKALRLVGEARKRGIPLVVTSGLRTMAEQARLYAQGRTEDGGIVTNAQPGQSFHNYGLAFDVAVAVNGKVSWDADWKAIGDLGKKVGLEWGGDFKTFPDRPHFQDRKGHTWQQLKQLHDQGKVKSGYVIV
jgi:peptidoglycan LD-endopeptidase CwlK